MYADEVDHEEWGGADPNIGIELLMYRWKETGEYTVVTRAFGSTGSWSAPIKLEKVSLTEWLS